MKQSRTSLNRQRVADMIQLPAPEPLTPREEAIEILASGLLELIIQRSRQHGCSFPTRSGRRVSEAGKVQTCQRAPRSGRS